MAQPSQEYPPWLTPVPSVVTDAAGSPVATVTGVSYIAPTYYGPSIPLGTLYSYGGYTYPPTVVWPSPGSITATPGIPTTVVTTGVSGTTTITTFSSITAGLPTATIPTTTIPSIVTTSGMSIISSTTSGIIPSPSIITTATPSTLTSTPVTPTTSTMSAPSTLTSTPMTPTTSTMSAPSTITPSVTPTTSTAFSPTVSTVSSSTSPAAPTPSGISQATGLTKGQLVGIVVASVLGLIFLFVLALFLYLWFKALRNRRQYATLSPIDDDYVVVPPGGRLPGEGSPRHSGEEHDSFLRPRGEISTAAAGAAASRPRGAQATANSNSSESSNSHASGFGVLLDRPSIGFTPSIPEELRTSRPLSTSEMHRLGREAVLPEETEYDDGEYTGAYAYSTIPPARLDPAAAPLLGHDLPLRRSKSSLPGEPEEGTVHTARRVKVEDLGPRELPDPGSSRKSILDAIGLGGLANLARKSWFKHFDSPRQSGAPTYEIEPFPEKDIEAGHEVLATEPAVDSFGIRTRGTPVAESQGCTRPVSRVSGRSGTSGATQYHDAQSSLQGGATSLTPPPRALTPVDQPTIAEQTWASSPLAGPPVYEDQPPAPSTPSRNNPQPSFEFPAGADILDMPAPTALTHFGSISSTKDSNSGSSFGMKPLLFPPPGLETIRAIGWANSPAESARGSFGFVSGRHIPSVDLDLLEEAPPEAENRWRSIAADSNRRGTFGTYVQGHDFASERASLYSHLSPSTRSTGSAPFGLEMGSVNSSASRPSAHSRSGSSGIHSLIHQVSIPSDMRRGNGSAVHSPALSAFGMRRASPGLDQSFDSTMIGTPPLVHVSPQKSDAIRSITSGSTTLFDTSARTLRGLPTPPRSDSGSPLSSNFQLNPPPWVAGLAHDWQPAP